jgi:hypothetical protein
MQLARDLDEGRIVDGKLVTLVYALRHRKPELFVALEPPTELQAHRRTDQPP